MSKLLILLGGQNDPTGQLKDAVKLRANEAIRLIRQDPDFKVICTGAFGSHFNESPTPHGRLLTDYLIKNGVAPSDILPFTMTSNTEEDAYGVLRMVHRLQKKAGGRARPIKEAHIVTSAFHMGRVKFIFGRVLQQLNLVYHEAKDPADPKKVREWTKDEKRKLKRLKKDWFDVTNFDLEKFPESFYTSLSHELRHYDTLSYWALLGAGMVFINFISDKANRLCSFEAFTVPKRTLMYFCTVVFFLIFWSLYHRFANTAKIVRWSMDGIEKLYGQQGLSRRNAYAVKFERWAGGAQRSIFLLCFFMLLWMIALVVPCRPFLKSLLGMALPLLQRVGILVGKP